jgi:hypothetical protein
MSKRTTNGLFTAPQIAFALNVKVFICSLEATLPH